MAYSITDLFNLFNSCDFPLFDQVADADVLLPFGVLIVTTTDNTPADNMTYCVNASARLELYTAYKDTKLCAQVENTLQSAKLPWQHDTDYISSQKTFMEVYTFGAVTGSVEPVPEV